MIINPFSVRLGRTRYDIVDRRAIDSVTDRLLVKQQVIAELAVQKRGATCMGIGTPELGDVDNLLFGVYVKGTLLGGILLTTLQSSGVWDDWASGSGSFSARPMPALPRTPTQEIADVHAAFGHHLLTKPMSTVGGHRLGFNKLSWAIFKGKTDPQNEKTRSYHRAFANDHARFKVTEVLDENDPTLTRVDAEAR